MKLLNLNTNQCWRPEVKNENQFKDPEKMKEFQVTRNNFYSSHNNFLRNMSKMLPREV